MKQLYGQNTSQQRGIALVSALLLLLAMTLVGVTSLRMNVSNEETAGNAYLREQALQAAEIALQYGESFTSIQPFRITTLVNNGCNGGFCIPTNFIPGTPLPDHWIPESPSVWDNNGQHIEVPANITAQYKLDTAPFPPSFIIEFMGHVREVEDRTLPDLTTEQRQKFSKCDLDKNGILTAAEGGVYPFCPNDPKLFRVTARGTSGAVTNPVQVMLQSTIVLP